jgi:serine/threonine protein kinase
VTKKGYAHMDIKATNIFVDHEGNCFLGDFGSCKPFGKKIRSTSPKFLWKTVINEVAEPVYDYFMFLVMIMI